MRTWKLRATALLVLFATSAFVVWPRPIVPGITQENLDRVEVGMSFAEVKALLGEPTSLDRDCTGSTMVVAPPCRDSCLHLRYEGEGDRYVSISFGYADGKVASKFAVNLLVREPPPHDILGWIKWQWRTFFPEQNARVQRPHPF